MTHVHTQKHAVRFEIEVHGPLTGPDAGCAFARAVYEHAMAQPPADCTCDLRECDAIDSGALGSLIALRANCNRFGKQLRVQLSEPLKAFLPKLGLAGLFVAEEAG